MEFLCLSSLGLNFSERIEEVSFPIKKSPIQGLQIRKILSDVYNDREKLYDDPNGLGSCPAASFTAMTKLGPAGKVEKPLNSEEKVSLKAREPDSHGTGHTTTIFRVGSRRNEGRVLSIIFKFRHLIINGSAVTSIDSYLQDGSPDGLVRMKKKLICMYTLVTLTYH